MELEQRIRALELEMKILKNEVQKTLLNVQEQVLLNERPVLAIESTPFKATPQAVEPARAHKSAASAVPTFSVAPTAPAASPLPPAATAPVVAPVPPEQAVTTTAPALRKVSLEEIRAAQSALEAEAMPADFIGVDKLVELVQKPAAESHDHSNGDAATLAERGGIKLLEWLMSGATKVDGERDEKRVNEVLSKLTKLNSLVDRASTIEEALRLIEEDKLG